MGDRQVTTSYYTAEAKLSPNIGAYRDEVKL